MGTHCVRNTVGLERQTWRTARTRRQKLTASDKCGYTDLLLLRKQLVAVNYSTVGLLLLLLFLVDSLQLELATDDAHTAHRAAPPGGTAGLSLRLPAYRRLLARLSLPLIAGLAIINLQIYCTKFSTDTIGTCFIF
eukprot:SAG31_NODE_1917_length_6923_cov_8.914897_8_plen_136_part_00